MGIFGIFDFTTHRNAWPVLTVVLGKSVTRLLKLLDDCEGFLERTVLVDFDSWPTALHSFI